MAQNPNVLNNIKSKWSSFDKLTKIGILGLFFALVASLIFYYAVVAKVKYTTLATDLSMKESGSIVSKLDEMKVADYKIANNGATILVSEKEVDKLRLDLAISDLLPEGGVGYEIFDDAGFAVTDEDRKIMYQRALEGELARSVMSLKEVSYARVHLAMPQETLFSQETQPGSATVIVDINPSDQITQAQVKGIISLVSSAVKNIPAENVSVVDTYANLLSENVTTSGNMTVSQTATESLSVKEKFENDIESDLNKTLETVFGKGKTAVNVNAVLDLNTKEVTEIKYDDNGILRSQQLQFQKTTSTGGTTSASSPVDNNIEYYSDTTNAQSDSTVSSYNTTQNYELGETQTHTIKAPGTIERLSISVMYDGELSTEKKSMISGIVAAAIGIDETRGDSVVVEGIAFDTTEKDAQLEAFKAAQEAYESQQKTQSRIKLYSSIGAGFVGLILLLIIISKLLSSGKKNTTVLPETMNPVVVSEMFEQITAKQFQDTIVPFDENANEKSIKKYADESPEKLAELVKTWILKDEE